MAFFLDDEVATLSVAKMILHVVKHTDEEFTPQPQIEVQEEGFFKARIVADAADGVHTFDNSSAVREIIQRIARGDISFETGGQALAARFHEFHVRQSVPGAFFVLELALGNHDDKAYALIKYDYREAVELTEHAGRSVLRAIVQAFVKDRKAMQKICLVRVRNGVADALVCAADRMKDAPDLTDYFERYLGVSRSMSNAELSKKLNEAIRQSVTDLRDHLPDRNIGRAVAAAKLALQGRATVSNDNVVDAVMHAANRPADEDIRSKIDSSVRQHLKRQKLQDVGFTPDPDTLRILPRQIVRTAEEVRLEFPMEELGNSVHRQDTADGVTFTIHTTRLIEDGTAKGKTR